MASRGLIALPNKQLIDFLNTQMKSKFNTAVLIGSKEINNAKLLSLLEKTATLTYSDIKNYIFDEKKVEVTYFDDEGVFTAIVNMTNENSYNKHLYAVGLFSDDKIVGTIAKTPIIFLNEQIGGQFPIKIPIKGEAGEVVFRNTIYLPEQEARERFLEPTLAMWSLNSKIQQELLAQEIKQIGG
jgi:hypothetical protein